jgi:hypothetical protein
VPFRRVCAKQEPNAHSDPLVGARTVIFPAFQGALAALFWDARLRMLWRRRAKTEYPQASVNGIAVERTATWGAVGHVGGLWK